MPELTPQTGHIEKEIANLEAALAEKKQTLANRQETLPNREIVRQAVRERMEQVQAPQVQPSVQVPAKEHAPIAPQDFSSIAPDKQVALLVNIALEHGIDQAAKTALALNDPFVFDSLHDQLTGVFYDELRKRNKIKEE